MEEFFAICPIGLENYLASELSFKWSQHFPKEEYECRTMQGGIEVKCKLPYGFALNHILRGTSKILWRLKKQKCRDVPKLYNIFKKFPWRNYLLQSQVEINITAKKSRLIHTDKIKSAALDGIADYFKANKIPAKLAQQHENDPKQVIFVRLNDDELTLSLDTSGALLHIRGDAQFRGHASIRENIACLLLWALLGNNKYAGFTLVDPMCGTATFLKEAKNQFKLINRKFNYQYLPEKLIENIPFFRDLPNEWDLKLKGSDIDPAVIARIDEISIDLTVKDIFEAKSNGPNNKNLVIINPPYGKRVKIQGDKQQYFKDLIKTLKSSYNPIKALIIIPCPYERPFKGEKIYFKQNGIDVCCLFISH